MTEFEKWQLIISGIQIVVSALIVIVAVAGDWARYKVFGGPKLGLSLDDPHGRLVYATPSNGSKQLQRWYHLRVTNKTKWMQANNVNVVIARIQRPSAEGRFVDQSQSGPLQFQRQYSVVYQSQSRNVGADQIFDLGYITENSNFQLSSVAFFTGNANCILLPNQKMRVVAQVDADNADSRSFCIDIAWDGQWSDDTGEMSNHLVIKIISA